MKKFFWTNGINKDGLEVACIDCRTKYQNERRKFGYSITHRKSTLPQTKTLKQLKKEVKTKSYMNEAVDRLGYLIADAILKQKYGVSDLSDIKCRR